MMIVCLLSIVQRHTPNVVQTTVLERNKMIQNLRVDLTFHLNFALRVLPTSRGQKNRVEEEMKECLSDIVNEHCI